MATAAPRPARVGISDSTGAVPQAPSQRMAPRASSVALAGKVKPTPGRRPTKEKAAPMGTLAVLQIHPWAEVFVDGKSQGFSAGRWAVAAGHHRVVLRNHDAFVDRSFEVDITAETTLLFTGDLKTLQSRSVE